jgi:hypothetical protein
MDEAELAVRRSQMGESACRFLGTGPRSIVRQGPGYWVALSGARLDDANLALVDTRDPTMLAHALEQIERPGFPTSLSLAGACRGYQLGPGWKHVRDAPFMGRTLSQDLGSADRRVREAGVEDYEVVSQIIADAFGLTKDVSDTMAGIVRHPDPGAKVWLLVVDERPVSTVLASIVEDAVCVWCAATPARFTRRGHCRALLAEVLSKASLQGATTGLLVSSPAGKPFYDATGWTTLETWSTFTNARWAQLAG